MNSRKAEKTTQCELMKYVNQIKINVVKCPKLKIFNQGTPSPASPPRVL